MVIVGKGQFKTLYGVSLVQGVHHAGFTGKTAVCRRIPLGAQIIVITGLQGVLTVVYAVLVPQAGNFRLGDRQGFFYVRISPVGRRTAVAGFIQGQFKQIDPGTIVLSAGKDHLYILYVLQIQTV